MRDKFTETAGLGYGPVSLEPYRSQEYFELEREKIFSKVWLNMGRVEDIADTGDYIVKDVEMCDASILLSRGKDGTIRAFHNVCSHRGNQLVWDRQGKRKAMFRCPYHSWTFNGQGDLIAVFDEDNFFDLDKKKCGLSRIQCDVWDGWIFINLNPQNTMSLKSYLGDMGTFLEGLPYPNPGRYITIQSYLNCNWKFVVDAFSEAYHIPILHSKTIGPSFSSKSVPAAHLQNVEFFGPHHSISLYGNPDYAPEEAQLVEKLAYSGMESESVLAANQSGDTQDLRDHPAVNPAKSNTWAMDINEFYPNFHIDVAGGGFWTHEVWPIRPDYTRYEFKFYVPKPETVREALHQEHYTARLVDTVLEDAANVERTQKGVMSRAKDHMILQENEVLVRRFAAITDRFTEADSLEDAMEACA